MTVAMPAMVGLPGRPSTVFIGTPAGSSGGTPTPTPAATISSMSLRNSAGGNSNGSLGPTGTITTRTRDMPFFDWANPRFEYWQGQTAATTGSPTEIGLGNGIYIRHALITGGPDKSLDQSAATVTPPTHAKAASCTPGYIWKLNGQTPTEAEYAAACAAAGATRLSADQQQLFVPDGWRAVSDAVPLSGLKNVPYYWATEFVGVQGDKYATTTATAARNDLADASWTLAGQITTKNWTGRGAGSIPAAIIWAEAPAGTPCLGAPGDSIADAQLDAADGQTAKVGDADGATGFVMRAASTAKIPAVRITRFGDNMTAIFAAIDAGQTGYAQRGIALRYCTHIYSEMGHNDRGQAGIIALMRRWHTMLRGFAQPGCQSAQGTLFPIATSSNDYIDVAGQTDTSGAYQWAVLDPYLRGVLNSAAGDPHRAFMTADWLYARAALRGWEVPAIPRRVWPANGQTRASGTAPMFDSTHPRGPVHIDVAIDLAAFLTTWIMPA